MKILTLILILFGSASTAQDLFQSNIKGVVNGATNGKLRLYEIHSRSGDEQIIDFKNGEFQFSTSNSENLIYYLAFQSDVEDDGVWYAFEFIMEEGTHEIILDFDSIQSKSSIIASNQNAMLQKFNQIYLDFIERSEVEGADEQALDSEFDATLKSFIESNLDNFISVCLLYQYHRWLDSKDVNYFVENISEKHRVSKYYRKVYSEYFGKERIAAGNEYIDFQLPNRQGEILRLSGIIEDNQLVLVEFWGSWCGPCIKKARKIKPIYAQYKNLGFEILGVALETNRQRWLDMLDKESYAWPNVIEMEQDQNQELIIANLYQVKGYPYGVLIDQKGEIISINPSVDDLSAILEDKLN